MEDNQTFDIEKMRHAQYNDCINYSPGPGGFSCINFIKENYAGADSDARESGLRNPISRDTLCARCLNHEEK
jgi:hypothetical protein